MMNQSPKTSSKSCGLPQMKPQGDVGVYKHPRRKISFQLSWNLHDSVHSSFLRCCAQPIAFLSLSLSPPRKKRGWLVIQWWSSYRINRLWSPHGIPLSLLSYRWTIIRTCISEHKTFTAIQLSIAPWIWPLKSWAQGVCQQHLEPLEFQVCPFEFLRGFEQSI